MLRIHFTVPDLLGVTIAGRSAPLMELGLAVANLQRADHPELFASWRTDQRRRLPRAGRPLFGLVPSNGAGPLFLDPLDDELDAALDSVRSTSRQQVTAELTRVCPTYRPVSPWVVGLANDDRDAWHCLASALRAAHDSIVAREWDRIRTSFDADVAWRTRLLATRGAGATLAGLYPGSTWVGDTLQIPLDHDADLDLGGRGLTVMPSTVWRGEPLIGTDADGRPLLLYPAMTPFPLVARRADDDPLAALLGSTRAAVLRSATGQRSVSELADDLDISIAAASMHAHTLAEARLLARRRDGRTVYYTPTGMGLDLLHGEP